MLILRSCFVSLIILTAAPARVATAQQLEFHMIGAVGNRPGVPVWAPPMREIVAGLHARLTAGQLATILGLSRDAITRAIDSLRADGIVFDRDGATHPSCMVISSDEGASLELLASRVATQAMPLVGGWVERLRSRYREISGFRNLEFSDVSFFLASDVLLDNWQIRAVERGWLGADRPLRGRARYYCSIAPITDAGRESFGIYGNQGAGVGDGRSIGVYGNSRGRGNDLASLSQSTLAALATLPDTVKHDVLLSRVLDRMQLWAREDGTAHNSVPEQFTATFEAMGLARQGKALFVVLDTADARRLDALAASATDSLVAFLRGVTPQLRSAWSSSSWHDEITFEEFSIWWYHFFYTAVTNQLAEKGAITIPRTGLFHYVMLP